MADAGVCHVAMARCFCGRTRAARLIQHFHHASGLYHRFGAGAKGFIKWEEIMPRLSNAFLFLLFSFPFLPFMFIFSIRRDSWSLGRSAGTCACEIRGCQAISSSVLLVRFLVSNSVLLVPDRVPPRILMCVGSIGAALMNLPIMARPPYGVLLLLRFLVGAFVAIGQSRNPSNVTQVELSS
jgi:hypothetical protein